MRERLLAARASRVRPARDDKVVAAWNGLAIASLAEAGVLLGEPRYVDAAVDAARLLVDRHLDGGRLRRVSRDGEVGRHAGVLEDYGCVAHGLLALLSATGDPAWLRTAGELLDTALELFAAPDGGFFDTAEDAERLVSRPRDPSDNASPSGQSALVHALLSYAAVTGSGRHRDAAEAALRTVHTLAERVPRFAGWSLAAAEAAVTGPLEVAVVGPAGDPARDELRAGGPRRTEPRGGGGRRRAVGGVRGPAARRPRAGRRPPGGVRLPRDGVRPSRHHARGAPRPAAALRPAAGSGLSRSATRRPTGWRTASGSGWRPATGSPTATG